MNVQEILSNLNNLPVCQNKEISYFLSKTQIKSFLDLLFLITPTQKKILFSLKNNETYIGIGSSTLGNFYFQIVNFDKSIHTKITPALLIHIKKHKISISKFNDNFKISLNELANNNSCNSKIQNIVDNIAINKITREPNFSNFKKQIETYKNSKLEKIVLSRTCVLPFKEKVNSQDLTILLFKNFIKKVHYKNNFFAYIEEEQAFISYTPESLFDLTGHKISTEALAGSFPVEQGEQLLTDSKNIQENSIVSKSITADLKPITKKLIQGKLKLRKLPYIVHLVCKIKGSINDNISFDDIINRLHPTPATLGYPKEHAMDFLEKNNKINRQLFAGTAGFHKEKCTKMIVLLRSAFITPEKITVYGGAGIMPQSNPTTEWLETAQKMTPVFTEICMQKEEQFNLLIKTACII